MPTDKINTSLGWMEPFCMFYVLASVSWVHLQFWMITSTLCTRMWLNLQKLVWCCHNFLHYLIQNLISAWRYYQDHQKFVSSRHHDQQFSNVFPILLILLKTFHTDLQYEESLYVFAILNFSQKIDHTVDIWIVHESSFCSTYQTTFQTLFWSSCAFDGRSYILVGNQNCKNTFDLFCFSNLENLLNKGFSVIVDFFL